MSTPGAAMSGYIQIQRLPWLNGNGSSYKIGMLLLGFTFSTDGDMELGPLDEKDATRGDTHFPMTDLGVLNFTVGDLH